MSSRSCAVAIVCIAGLLACPAAAGAAVKLTQRASTVEAKASFDKRADKTFDSFGAWSESASASNSGTCTSGGGAFSASGHADHDSDVSANENSVRVTDSGHITGSGTGTCPDLGPAKGGGGFGTLVRFTVAGAPLPYTASGSLGSNKALVSLFDANGGAYVFNVVGPGGFSFSGELSAGEYTLQFQEGLDGQAVSSSSNLDFRVGGPPAKCEGIAVTIFEGDAGPDIINGTGSADVVNGKGGSDTLSGLNGKDRVCGAEGDDSLFGGGVLDNEGSVDGKDRLFGGSGDDALDGGGNADRLFGFTGNDKLFGRDGRDFLDGGDGRDKLDGGGADDKLLGGPGKRDVLRGGSGGDNLSGGPGANDKCIGGPGTDTADNSCEIISGVELVGLD